MARQPPEGKKPAWTRFLDVAFRTAHVAAIGVLFGGAVCGVPLPGLSAWTGYTIATGCALVASELYHCGHWPYQGRGVLGLAHLALFGFAVHRPDGAAPLLAAALVLGMVGSHMPKGLRYWSIVHRRVISAGEPVWRR